MWARVVWCHKNIHWKNYTISYHSSKNTVSHKQYHTIVSTFVITILINKHKEWTKNICNFSLMSYKSLLRWIIIGNKPYKSRSSHKRTTIKHREHISWICLNSFWVFEAVLKWNKRRMHKVRIRRRAQGLLGVTDADFCCGMRWPGDIGLTNQSSISSNDSKNQNKNQNNNHYTSHQYLRPHLRGPSFNIYFLLLHKHM